MAASSARELDAILDSWFVNFIAMFRLLPSAYHTPMPAVAFSQPLFTAEPSVLIFAKPPPGSMSFLVLAGLLSLRNGSPSFDLCPGIFPKILIPPSRQCVDLVSGLNVISEYCGSLFLFLLILFLLKVLVPDQVVLGARPMTGAP